MIYKAVYRLSDDILHGEASSIDYNSMVSKELFQAIAYKMEENLSNQVQEKGTPFNHTSYGISVVAFSEDEYQDKLNKIAALVQDLPHDKAAEIYQILKSH